MSWWSQMRRRLRNALMPGRQTSEPDHPLTQLVMQSLRTKSGQVVTPDNALKDATVWACVAYLTRTVAQLPWRVMRDSPSGPERVPTHPLQYLLAVRPNPEMGAFTFRETLTGWAVRRGNGIAEIQRDARQVPIALWPIHPSRYCFERDSTTGELLYGIEPDGGGGGKVYLKAKDVLHLRGYGEGAVGLDVMSYAAESIGWARATSVFGATYFGNGAHADGFIQTPSGMTKEAKRQLDKEIKAKHGGADNAHGIVMLDADMKFVATTQAPDDAQFIETRQHQVEEICRWFGVPPHKVMHLLRGTFSNIEHQSIEVVVDSITPWAIRWEQEADYKLFGQNRQAFYTKLDLKGLQRGDFKSRQEGLQLMRRNGVINANEWRQLEDMNTIGDDGEKYIVEGNMTTLEAVGQTPPPGAPAAEPPQDDAGATQDDVVARARRQLALVH